MVRVVGSVFLVRPSRTTSKLRLLVLHPKARGLGLGRRLAGPVSALQARSDTEEMTLWTQSHRRPAARAIYQAKASAKFPSSSTAVSASAWWPRNGSCGLPSAIVKALLAGVALLALQGCAGGLLSQGSAQALPPLEPSKGRVVFYRTSSLGAAYIPDVLLNGERVGRPNRPGVFFRDVPPGIYAVTTTRRRKSCTSRWRQERRNKYIR